jgi:hypothetical protein
VLLGGRNVRNTAAVDGAGMMVLQHDRLVLTACMESLRERESALDAKGQIPCSRASWYVLSGAADVAYNDGLLKACLSEAAGVSKEKDLCRYRHQKEADDEIGDGGRCWKRTENSAPQRPPFEHIELESLVMPSGPPPTLSLLTCGTCPVTLLCRSQKRLQHHSGHFSSF